jgi:hypothetical protein
VIDLIGGLRDYSVTLRRLFSARGNILPRGGELINPVIDVGPSLLHPWATPRVSVWWSDTVSPATTLTRWIVNPEQSNAIYLLTSFRSRFAASTTSLAVEVLRVRVSSFNQGGGVNSITNQAIPALDSLTGATTGTVVTALDAFILRSSQLEVEYAQDREDTLWPGMAYQVSMTNNDAVNRASDWIMSLHKFQAPST